MVESQTLKSVDFTKTQKSRYLKKLYFMVKNSFVAEVTFKKSISYLLMDYLCSPISILIFLNLRKTSSAC